MAQTRAFPSAVAIPVRNEEAHIGACLAALIDQSEPPDHILLLLNNTTDRSAEVVRRLDGRKRGAPAPIVHVVERSLPPSQANAGTARRLAMDAAAALVGPRGAILTTDADGRVPGEWVARSLAALRGGVDAVCGMAAIDPVDEAAIPAHLVADDALETRYTEILDEIDSILDPRPHDPWPRHTHGSGASIAISAAVYRAVGGVPNVAHGEDRALITALDRRDCKIRHDPALSVIVSGRVVGRADGGMAATIARRMLVQDRWADDRLEPVRAAIRRSRLRAEARLVWTGRRHASGLATALDLPHDELARLMRSPWFGTAWAAIEGASPALRRSPIAMAELAQGVREAEAMLARLKMATVQPWPTPARMLGTAAEPRPANRREAAGWTR
ncbi:MAG: glycosyltransferase [Proteobacteria bacterium]|nr:glycosyltransferase [Pseudomonadota bacterium]